MEYTRVSTDENSNHELDDIEEKELLPSSQSRRKPAYLTRSFLTAQGLIVFNVCLAAFLGFTLLQVKRNANCIPGPQPPWCKHGCGNSLSLKIC